MVGIVAVTYLTITALEAAKNTPKRQIKDKKSIPDSLCFDINMNKTPADETIRIKNSFPESCSFKNRYARIRTRKGRVCNITEILVRCILVMA